MNIYHIWANIKEGITAEDFVSRMQAYLDRLVETGNMECYRIMRMKLGFRSLDIPEFHIMMEFKDMCQLDQAMSNTLQDEKTDTLHVGFNQWVDLDTIQHALYRDFPD